MPPRSAFIGDRWFRSGDVAVSDASDVITIIDRLKDVYISGGENVYPAEVEKALCDHELVAEAAVIGVADATWGEVGKAFIVLAEGGVASEEELTAHLADPNRRVQDPAVNGLPPLAPAHRLG